MESGIRLKLPFAGGNSVKMHIAFIVLTVAAMLLPGAAAADDSPLSEIVFYVQ